MQFRGTSAIVAMLALLAIQDLNVEVLAAPGEASKLQGINYYDGKSSYHRTSSPFTVPYCGSDSSTETAQLTLTCAAKDNEHDPVGFPSASGSCAVWASYIAYSDLYDASCNDVNPPLPAVLGTWNARCDLPKECAPEGGHGGYEHHDSNTEIRIEGEVWYSEDAYVKDLSCFDNGGAGDDYGLIYLCVDCPLKRKAGSRQAPRSTHRHAKHGRSGNNTRTGKAHPAPKKTAKITYDRDEDATYYKLDYVYLLAGAMTQYDRKHGEVKYVGEAQIVEDLVYARDNNDNAIAVPASSLPSTALVVDCTSVHFKWLDTHEQY